MDFISDFDNAHAALIFPGLQSLQVECGDCLPCLGIALVKEEEEEEINIMVPPNHICFLDIDCKEVFLLFDLNWRSHTLGGKGEQSHQHFEWDA